MAGLYEMMTRKKPKSAAEELKGPESEPTPGGLGGKISTSDVMTLRPKYNDYRINGGEMSWEMYVDHYKKNGTLPE